MERPVRVSLEFPLSGQKVAVYVPLQITMPTDAPRREHLPHFNSPSYVTIRRIDTSHSS
jgi:hypothetical protein